MQRIHTHTENEFFYARLGRCHTLDFSLLLDLTAVDQVFLIKNISAAFQRVLMYLTMSAASKIQKYYSFKWELKDKRNLINQHTYCSTFITSSICSKDCLKLKCRTNNQIRVWDIMQTSCIISLCIRCYFWLWQCVLCTLAYVNQRIFVKHMNSSVSYECKLCLYLHSWGPFWTINVVGLGSWVVGKGGLGVPKLWVGGYKKLLETKIQITTRKVSEDLYECLSRLIVIGQPCFNRQPLRLMGRWQKYPLLIQLQSCKLGLKTHMSGEHWSEMVHLVHLRYYFSNCIFVGWPFPIFSRFPLYVFVGWPFPNAQLSILLNMHNTMCRPLCILP